MRENGVVIKTNGKIATVRIGRHSACGNCGMCGMTENSKHVDFQTVNTLGAKTGDEVSVEIKDTNTLKISTFAYLLPMVFGLVLFGVGALLQLSPLISMLMFFAGCALAFAVVSLVDKNKKHKWVEAPELVEILKIGEKNEQNS